jgi:hypothetical protein
MESFKLFHQGPQVFYYIGDKGTLKTFRIKTMEINTLTPSVSKTCKSDKQGYLQTQININGKNKNFRIHRLVAENFVKRKSGPQGSLEVNHINGNKHDNMATNLQWVTRSVNTKHAHDNRLIKNNTSGLITYNKNVKYRNKKYTKEEMAVAVMLARSGETYKVASNSTGIPYKVIWHYDKRSRVFGALKE